MNALRNRSAFAVMLLAAVLAGCVEAPPAAQPTASPVASPVASPSAGPHACGLLTPPPTPDTTPGGGVATAMVSTVVVEPSSLTPQPALPTPTLVPEPPLTNTQLRYDLIAALGQVAYCDPEDYPIPRPGEPERAAQWFDQVDRASDEIRTIARVKQLGKLDALTAEQKVLVYRQHKMLSTIRLEACDGGYAFQFETVDNLRITGWTDGHGNLSDVRKEDWFISCPICLSANTLIDTPAGALPVSKLRAGMAVWTTDADGRRVKATIVRTVRVPVDATHLMVRLRLDDGRELLVSPGHPAADGRRLGDLQPGDALDGAHVVSAERVPYGGDATYDLLPSGATGAYWANGVLIGSTLAGR
jgi:hypothetical protein